MKITTKEEISQALKKIEEGRGELMLVVISGEEGADLFFSTIPKEGEIGLYKGKITIFSPYYSSHRWGEVEEIQPWKLVGPAAKKIVGPLRFKIAPGATEIFIGKEIEAKPSGNDALFLESSVVPMISQILYFLLARAIGVDSRTQLLREIGQRVSTS